MVRPPTQTAPLSPSEWLSTVCAATTPSSPSLIGGFPWAVSFRPIVGHPAGFDKRSGGAALGQEAGDGRPQVGYPVPRTGRGCEHVGEGGGVGAERRGSGGDALVEEGGFQL